MNIKLSLSQFNPYSLPFKKTPNTNPANLEKSPKSDTFELSVGYVNDIHGQTNNMMRILSGIKGDLKLSAGDICIGDEKNKAVNKSVVKFLNMADIKASALGNHEFDTTQKDFADSMKDYNGNILAINVSKDNQKEQSPEDAQKFGRIDLSNHIKPSKIVEIKGEKIGLIGAAPIDLKSRVTHPSYHEDCSVESFEETVKHIQKEINSLKEQGVNKIFLLSHMGHLADKVVATNTDGIDVIIGGHTHELVKDIKENENLFYSLSGEPVIITEAGKDGKYFGELKLSFDEDGIIAKAQNNLGKTADFPKNLIVKHIFNQELGEPEVVGYIKNSVPPPNALIEENAHANFVCDAMRYEMDADIAIWNNSGTRSFFAEGVIDSRDIKDIAPFEDRIAVANVSEKKLVDMFKHAIDITYKSQGYKPGLLAVSGLNYTVDAANHKLKAMSFIDKDGNDYVIDVENPREDKFYKVVQDTFMMYEGADYISLAPKNECENYPFNKDYLTCEYIKHLNKPIEINQTGRINFEN